MTRIPSPFSCHLIRSSLEAAPLTIVDVGAAGGIDLFFRRFVDRCCIRFFGFEPNPEQFAGLKEDAITRYYPYAISDKVVESEFYAHSTIGSLARRRLIEAQQQIPFRKINVPVTTLTALRTDDTLPTLDILKIDTEGHDYFVLKGIDDPFFDELLCVKVEFAFAPSDDAPAFADIDRLLGERGFLLFGLKTNIGVGGELSGGDALYLRSIGSLLTLDATVEVRRLRVIKLICTCFLVRNLDYAYICARAAHDAELLSDSEIAELCRHIERAAYLPSILAAPRPIFMLSHVFSMLSQLTAGWLVRSKSAARDNRLDRLGPLFVPTAIPGVRARLVRDLRFRYRAFRQERLADLPESDDSPRS